MKKYELVAESKIVVQGKTLFRIRALIDIEFGNVKKGDFGGYIEKEDNLSHHGNAWVYGDALVYGDARVGDNARVYGDALVYGDARVGDNARVYGDARVGDNARVYGDALVYGDARVYGDAEPKDFWFIDPEILIACESTDPLLCDKKVAIETMKQIGNYFETKEEAEKAVERLRAWKRLKDKGFRFEGWQDLEACDETEKLVTNRIVDGENIIGFSMDDYHDCIKDLNTCFGGEE